MNDIEKLLGEGAIPSPSQQLVKKHFLTTGFLNLDFALGGGIPIGSLVEIVGDTGKTTLVLGIMAEHPQSLYINCDYAFDEYYASLIGVSNDALIVNPTNLFGQLEMAILAKIPLIIVDSAAGIVTEEEEDRGVELSVRMEHIKLLNKDSVIIFTNQFRWNGSRTIAGDNHAIKRNADIRMLIEPQRKKDDLQLYTINVLRNKFYPPTPPICLAQYLGEGFSKEWDLIDFGINNGFITTNGNLSFTSKNGFGCRFGRGLKQSIDLLKREPALYRKIKERMLWDMK